MTRHYLAIPFGSFLLFSFLLPACAQTTPDNSQSQPPAATAAPGQPQNVSEEELARLYLIRKDYAGAQQIFHKLTVEQPKNAVYWNELGITYHDQMQLDPALKYYKKSAKVDPKYADVLNNIGAVYYEMGTLKKDRGKYAKAIRYYRKAIDLRGDYASFYLNLGYAEFAHNDYEEAISAFRRALQLDPDAFDSSKSRAGTVIQDRSVAFDRARFYFLLAKSFAESGNAERCLIYLKKAREEGYQDLEKSVNKDASFAKMIKTPAIQEFLVNKPPDTAQP
jgi:tetratricopeptide (TPR) repeat protein